MLVILKEVEAMNASNFMLNPNLHIICGKCGCNHMITYKVKEDLNDDTGEKIQIVYLYCGNCSTVTDLDEVIKREN